MIVDPNPPFLFQWAVATITAFVAAHYMSWRWLIVCVAMALSLAATTLAAQVCDAIAGSWYDFLLDPVLRGAWFRHLPDGEMIAGLVCGLIIPSGACWLVAAYLRRKSLSQPRLSVAKLLVVTGIFGVICAYLVWVCE
jgi:hypothetical protein